MWVSPSCRVCCGTMVVSVGLLLAFTAGCDKIPKMSDLAKSNNKQAEDLSKEQKTDKPGTAPAAQAKTSAPTPEQPKVRPQPPKPAGPDPDLVIGQFLKKSPPQRTDADLQALTALDSKLDTITEVDLTGSKVTPAGLELLAKLPNLRSLTVSAMELSEGHFQAIAKLTGLRELHARSYRGEPAALRHLNGMPQLEVLDLAFGARVDDNALTVLEDLPALKEIDLMGTPVTDAGVPLLSRFPALQKINLHKSRIMTGDGFKKLETPDLRWLNVSETGFSRLGFVHLKKFRHLETFICGNAGVVDSNMPGLVGLPNLRELNLSFNSLTDAGMQFFARAAFKNTLEVLSLQANRKITDRGATFLKGFKALKELDLRGTAITPATVAAMRQYFQGAVIKHP